MSRRLDGMRVAVTGGARGIGRATAAALAEAGAQVVIGDIDGDTLAGTAAELTTATGAKVIGVRLDVRDPESFEEFLGRAEAELGGLDALINNAGIMPTGSFLEESMEVADRQVDINLRGVIIGSKLAARRFAERRSGHIVNVASVLGLIATPDIATYAATKYGVVGLGTALHQELEKFDVRVSTLCPAFVNTQLIAGLSPNRITRFIGFVEPEDVARAVVGVLARRRGGLRVVPRIGGVAIAVLTAMPEGLRYRFGRLLGSHDTVAKADMSQRAAYLERAERG
ncbi:SDR family NAD(P)-dependent oxidoreductase [Nocardia paucivorans]|uniref:SDR family NAD(P)-dependent oxidoreductase n=1 Tax=Nocardia paucivorans TaxID=114259 RepID=UPI0002D76C09|nr:SDR family NAD(P)-dependent oxidoreductase [Nocardia paucivorans]